MIVTPASWRTPRTDFRTTVQATCTEIPRHPGEALPGDVYRGRACVAFNDTAFALELSDDDRYLDALARRLEAL